MDTAPSVRLPLAAFLERLAALEAAGPVRLSEDGAAFEGEGPAGRVRLEPPLLDRIPPGVATPEAWRARLAHGPRLQALLLLQAGAVALGLWRGDDLLAHKCFKKYVVRGKGKAQPTHLKTKGKSRAGSRLRLRNFEASLVETNERLGAWWREHGPFDEVYRSVPVRIWPELFEVEPPPPFPRDDPRVVRIPIHVHLPGFDELLRVRRALARGPERPLAAG
jgi:hypothetical protein